jgi:hypothetical protein
MKIVILQQKVSHVQVFQPMSTMLIIEVSDLKQEIAWHRKI